MRWLKGFEMGSLSWMMQVGPESDRVAPYKSEAGGCLGEESCWAPPCLVSEAVTPMAEAE